MSRPRLSPGYQRKILCMIPDRYVSLDALRVQKGQNLTMYSPFPNMNEDYLQALNKKKFHVIHCLLSVMFTGEKVNGRV